MDHEKQHLNRRGSAALFALLLTFLLGAGAPAAAFADASPAAVKQLHAGKAAGLVRALRRVSDEDGDPETTPFWLGGDAALETSVVSFYPAVHGAAAPSVARAAVRRSPFQARAPPAA